LDGFADEDDCSVFRLNITKKISDKFPELKVGQVLELREDDNGFVYSKIVEPQVKVRE
jgi:hypothetical protein